MNNLITINQVRYRMFLSIFTSELLARHVGATVLTWRWLICFWLIDKQVSRGILSRGLSGVTWAKSYEPHQIFFSSQSKLKKQSIAHICQPFLGVVLKSYQRVWELWCDHVSSSSHTWYGCAQVIILKRAFRRNVSFNLLKSGYRWNAQTRLFSPLLELLP